MLQKKDTKNDFLPGIKPHIKFVVFSQHIYPDLMLIEKSEKGKTSSFLLPRDFGLMPESALQHKHIQEIYQRSVDIENLSKKPQRIEYAADDNQVYLLQSVPITKGMNENFRLYKKLNYKHIPDLKLFEDEVISFLNDFVNLQVNKEEYTIYEGKFLFYHKKLKESVITQLKELSHDNIRLQNLFNYVKSFLKEYQSHLTRSLKGKKYLKQLKRKNFLEHVKNIKRYFLFHELYDSILTGMYGYLVFSFLDDLKISKPDFLEILNTSNVNSKHTSKILDSLISGDTSYSRGDYLGAYKKYSVLTKEELVRIKDDMEKRRIQNQKKRKDERKKIMKSLKGRNEEFEERLSTIEYFNWFISAMNFSFQKFNYCKNWLSRGDEKLCDYPIDVLTEYFDKGKLDNINFHIETRSSMFENENKKEPESKPIILNCKVRVQGNVRKLKSQYDISRISKDDIIVVEDLLPQFTSAICLCKGLIAERGSVLCHAALVAQEFGVPCAFGIKDAMKKYQEGQVVVLDQHGVHIISDH